ncbi:MAG: nucleotide-binding protein [Opitutaceae bacterium]
MRESRFPRLAGWAVALGLFASALPAVAAPHVYSAKEAKDHVGEFASVRGVVERAHVSHSGMEFLDFDGAYPNAPFTAVVFAADASAVGDLSDLEGKRVTVTGKIAEYKGKPEIVVRRRDELKTDR